MAMPIEIAAVGAAIINAHHSAIIPDSLTILTQSRWRLEGASDFWARALEYATAFVALGVLIEIVATILEVLEERGHGEAIKWHQIWTFVGGALVAIFVVVEFEAELKSAHLETKLRGNNASAQAVLDKKERDATAQAVAIAKSFGGLQNFVSKKEGEISTAEQRLSGDMADEKKQTDRALTAFKSEQSRLETARSGAEGSAAKAATASDAATRTAISMNATLASEQQMQAQMRAVITHRILSDDDMKALAAALRPFGKIPFDLFVADDPDARDLAEQLRSALVQAGWDWRDAANIGDLAINVPNGKRIGLMTVAGIHLEFSEAKRPQFDKPTVTLRNFILSKGWLIRASTIPDDKMAKEYDHGIIHIFVGTRD
jgi:hypothetical protein